MGCAHCSRGERCLYARIESVPDRGCQGSCAWHILGFNQPSPNRRQPPWRSPSEWQRQREESGGASRGSSSSRRACSRLRGGWARCAHQSPGSNAQGRNGGLHLPTSLHSPNLTSSPDLTGSTLRRVWTQWGILPDKPSLLFADFGGGMHELSLEAWPAFTSTRCSDGETVKGALEE